MATRPAAARVGLPRLADGTPYATADVVRTPDGRIGSTLYCRPSTDREGGAGWRVVVLHDNRQTSTVPPDQLERITR